IREFAMPGWCRFWWKRGIQFLLIGRLTRPSRAIPEPLVPRTVYNVPAIPVDAACLSRAPAGPRAEPGPMCGTRTRGRIMNGTGGAAGRDHPAPLAGVGGTPAAAELPDDLHALRAVVEGTAAGIGREFFRSLVRHVAEAIGVPYSAVCEFDTPPQGRVL